MQTTRPNLDELFHQAAEIDDSARRAAFLDAACAGDVSLRQEIEALLRHDQEGASFLESPPAGILDIETAPPSGSDFAGGTIGRYKLLEQIGEGGMGVVFVAEQTEPVRRRVALKVIKPGMDSKQVIARFEAERQALAMMDHPNIARIYDAGTTGEGIRSQESGVSQREATSSLTPDYCPLTPSAGRPYFVMELVRGLPITDYCDKARLTPRQRLELFIDVCHAVQHAHQKGIIHRDLKPSNVMVTVHDGSPIAKVIDFGVAKAVGQQLTERTVYTAHAQLVGTPVYMSPEQADLSSQDVDTRSDVYSLGVLLYELLTGQPPFDKDTLHKAGFDEMRRIIREEEPETVSQRLARTKSAVGRQLQNADCRLQNRSRSGAFGRLFNLQSAIPNLQSTELDWIVAKSLEKAPSRRYESASAFATDIQRYLADEPVQACPPTALYRFQKFARKHKPALATAAAIALCLVLGTTVSAWQAVRATTAEAQAQANEEKANVNAAAAQEKEKEAVQKRNEVQILNDDLRATQSKLQNTLYIAHVNMARHAWDSFAIDQMQDLLDEHRPKAGDTDLRGFEWRYLYRLCHMEPVLTIKGNARAVNGVAFSPDGKRIATASSGFIRQDGKAVPVNPEVKIWDAATGQELLPLKGHTGEVKTVAFSPDGKRLASGGSIWDETTKTIVSGEVKLWDAETGLELISFKGHKTTVNSVSFSPDGKRLAVGSGRSTSSAVPGELKIWDAQTGEELLPLQGHTDVITNVAFSPDGTRLASSSWDSTVKMWDTEKGHQVLSVEGAWGGSVTFSPDGKRFANGRRVYDSQTGKPLLTIDLFDANGMLFSPDGKRLVSTAHNQPVRVYDSRSGKELFAFKTHTSGVRDIALSPDGKRLALADGDGSVKIWDATASPEHRSASQNTRIMSVTFSPDGKHLASSGEDGVKISNAQTGQDLLSIKGQVPGIGGVGLAYSPDGKRLASAGGQSIKVWDAETGKEHLSLAANGFSVAFSPDGKRLVGGRRELKVWDAQSGQEVLSVNVGPAIQIWDVAFNPDGKRVACGGGSPNTSGGVQIIDAQTGAKLLFLEEKKGGVMGIAYSPDGKRIASSSYLGSVRIWDAESGRELMSLKGHIAAVKNVVFSPDGKRLATLSEPLTVKVFDAQSGQETLSLKGGNGRGLAFSPDGNLLAGAAWEAVMIYDATPLPEKP